MNWKHISLWCLMVLLFVGCQPKNLVTVDFEERNLDTVSVTASKGYQRPPYNPSYTRRNDLLHSKLDVRFDWNRQHVLGKATLTLKPLFYDTETLRLDAKGFDIREVSMMKNGKKTRLPYKYEDAANLFITLDKKYTADQEYTVYIEYTAKPNELPVGGSAAITQDKGLYFINPTNETPGKPQQIWTQGETESNSKWFPTIDRPNERCTQEIFVTIDKKYQTLSNGVLKSAKPNTDGTRTDHWVMDMPHAPYLFMLAIGEFSVVLDYWEGRLLQYYVEPEYKDHAKAIFKHTPEMLTFFSNRLGVEYPWQKYSQVIVRDYVSGAMENTTAVIFGDFVQMTTRELLDHSDMNESIVAHEMMHHWFGDLVTCESWANLPLNESFANYSEYLWFEHKYGQDAADHIRAREMAGYMTQAVVRGDAHPLIYYGYADKEEMFDAHSYNKGGTILHMLRKHIGDKAFFEALRIYLETNKFSAVEVHDLRLAFEKVTGEDLSWFFNQWFFTKGHPKLKIKKKYDSKNRKLNVTIEQTQNPKESTVFKLPFDIAIYLYEGDKPQVQSVVMEDQIQTFSFDVRQQPLWVSIDSDRRLLCERTYDQTVEELVFQYRASKNFMDRNDALKALRYKQKDNPEVRRVFEDALKDPFWSIRERAIDGIELSIDKDMRIIRNIESIAKDDKRSQVRAAAIDKLGSFNDERFLTIPKDAVDKDQSYMVIAAAINAIYNADKEEGVKYAEKLKNENNISILLSVAEIFSATGDVKYTSFFDANYKKMSNYNAFSFFDYYAELLKKTKDDPFILAKASDFREISTTTDNGQWLRYASANAIKKLRDNYKKIKGMESNYNTLNSYLEEIKRKEKDATLSKLYKNWK